MAFTYQNMATSRLRRNIFEMGSSSLSVEGEEEREKLVVWWAVGRANLVHVLLFLGMNRYVLPSLGLHRYLKFQHSSQFIIVGI